MKNLLIIISFFTVITASAQTKKGKLYPFKSAVIEYTYEGNTTGRHNLYIDNYGWLQCEMKQTVSKAFGQKSEEAYVKVSKDFDMYQWDPKTRIGSKLRNTLAEDMMNDPTFNPAEFGKRTMESLGFKKTGTETITGKVCEVWKGLGGTSTIWMWNSLALKNEIKMLGTKTTWVATVVKIDEGVPAGKFDLPTDVRFGDAGTTDPVELMNKAMKEAGDSADKNEKTEEVPIKNLKDLKGFLKKLKTQ